MMTLEEVTAVGAVVGAVGSTIAALVGVTTWISAVRSSRRDHIQAEQADWSISLDRQDDGILTAQLNYSQRRGLQMRSIRVVKPRKCKIQYYCLKWKPIGSGGVNSPHANFIELVGDAAPALVCKRLFGRTAAESSAIQLLVYLPDRSSWSRKDATRLRIEVKAEATTAGRRQSTIIVTSDEIPWTAKQTASSA